MRNEHFFFFLFSHSQVSSGLLDPRDLWAHQGARVRQVPRVLLQPLSSAHASLG